MISTLSDSVFTRHSRSTLVAVQSGSMSIPSRTWPPPMWLSLFLTACRSDSSRIFFDSGLKGNDFVSFVATDNRKGGRLAGEHLAQLLHDAGTVVMLRYA